MLRSLGHRAPLLWLVLPWMAGMGIGLAFDLRTFGWYLALATAAAGAAAWGKSRGFWAPMIVMAGVLSGAASYALHRQRIAAWDQLPTREARLALRVTHVFASGDPRRIAGLAVIDAADGHLHELVGQRTHFSLQLPKGTAPPIRSAVIRGVGLLEPLPARPPAGSFDGYLAATGMNFKFGRGRLLAELRPPNAYYRFCAEAAGRFRDILGRGIAEKRPALAGLLRAMMLGEIHELTDTQHALFLQSGTMHLFAISGLNIGVIATSLYSLLLLLRVPTALRFGIATTLLWLFVDITGASPSAVRAFAMVTFVYLARALRRPNNGLAAVTTSAFVVLLVAPLQVFSTSFILSYSIVATLLIYGSPMAEAWQAAWSPWRDLPEQAWTWSQHKVADAWRSVSTAVAVGIATTPVAILAGIQFFQLITPGAVLANLALIPAAMAVTVHGFAAIVFGLLHFDSGVVLANHAAALTLAFIEQVVRVTVALPGAHIPARFVAAWIGPLALPALMALLLVGYSRRWQPRAAWWLPFALVLITLAFGVTFG